MIQWLYFSSVAAFFAVLAVLCLRGTGRQARRANTVDLVNEYVMHTDNGWRATLDDIYDLPEAA